MAKIVGFEKGSCAKRAGLKIGDDIVSIENHPLRDVLDYLFFDCEKNVSVDFNRQGKKQKVVIHKSECQSLGIDFGAEFVLTPHRCKNKCVFCFVDQLPKNMRETLYVKDDDYRLSCVSGNYVTLTNLTQEDVDRIIEYKISPLYISVHAVNPDVRKKMITNPNATKLIEYIQLFAKNGIKMHTQVVLIEGVNDGAVLDETIKTLYSFYPSVQSLAVVPVGLTEHREGLYPILPLSQKCVTDTIAMVEAFNKEKDFCWCSDEFYVRADKKLPSADYYGNFSQIENGVGLIATFLENIDNQLNALTDIDLKSKKVALITGVSFSKTLKAVVEQILAKIKNVTIEVITIENNFFGKNVTVAGLIVGKDLLEQTPRGFDKYIIPKNMLREFEDVFLDGTTFEQIVSQLKNVAVSDALGEDLLDKIIED